MTVEAWPFGDGTDREAAASAVFDPSSPSAPTDTERAMLASFADEARSYLAEMGGSSLAAVIFRKNGPDNWGYEREGHAAGSGLPLAALMDRVHAYGGEEPPQRWQAWKAAHPDVFGAGVPQ